MLMTSSNGTHVNKLVTSKLAMKGNLEQVVTSLAKAKESFWTNCLDKLFANTNTVNNLNRTQLYKMLSFTLKQNHFLFDGKVYNQVDGVAMGSPLGPVMANIFMCELERKALEQYSGTLPSLYRRYVDDTFLVFNTSSDMLSFFKWMNKQHPSITFTKEEEQDNKLSFLDVLLTRTTDGSIVTSIYRKPTFSAQVVQERIS